MDTENGSIKSGDCEGLAVLRFMRVLGTCVNFELTQYSTTETVVGNHALHSPLNEQFWTALADALDVFDLLIADVACLGGVDLLSLFLAAEAHFSCIEDDDEISSINVRSKDWLGFTTQDVGGGHSDISKNLILGINDVPLTVGLFLGFSGECLHVNCVSEGGLLSALGPEGPGE